jgi:hypothetical protein
LVELTLALAGQMLVHGGKAKTLRQGVIMARDHLLNGKAWQKFRQMVMVQGGDISVIDTPENYVPAKFSVSVGFRISALLYPELYYSDRASQFILRYSVTSDFTLLWVHIVY